MTPPIRFLVPVKDSKEFVAKALVQLVDAPTFGLGVCQMQR